MTALEKNNIKTPSQFIISLRYFNLTTALNWESVLKLWDLSSGEAASNGLIIADFFFFFFLNKQFYCRNVELNWKLFTIRMKGWEADLENSLLYVKRESFHGILERPKEKVYFIFDKIV